MSENLPSDRGFLGVNMRLAPHLLPPGYVSEARNARFNQGIIETRLGALYPTWGQKLAGSPLVPGPWTALHGLGVFHDPATDLDYLIIAADGAIYRVHPYNVWTQMTLPAGVTIAETVTFTQAGTKLIMHRGFQADPLWLEAINGAWDFLPEPDPATGTQGMPRAERSLYFQGRMWIPKDDDTIAYSDFNDPTSYQATTQEFYINPGSADKIVTLAKVGRSTLVVFKSRSIHVIYGVYGNLASVQGDTLTLAFGCVAAESVVDVGNEIWFLSQDGLRSLVHSEFGEQGSVQIKQVNTQRGEAVPVVVSDDVKPLFDRLNPQYQHLASGAFWNRRFYLSIPLDAAEVLGPELVPDAIEMPSGFNILQVATRVGHTYRFDPGGTVTSLVNNATVITTPGTFVAELAYVQIHLTTTLDLSLREVLATGCNTAVAVYDFQNGAWSGYDVYAETGMAKLITMPVLNRDQLLAITTAGWVAMLEQDYQDATPVPFVDVRVTRPFTAGGTFSVNGGTTVTVATSHPADPGIPVNDTATWGLPHSSHPEHEEYAARNLFVDANGVYGFSGAGGTAWTAPNTQVLPLDDGVRFRSTNGKMPAVLISSMVAAEVSEHWALDIPLFVSSRGYTHGQGQLCTGLFAELDVATWDADVVATFKTSRVLDEHAIAEYAPDRTRWLKPANRAAYDGENNNGEALEPDREDYSVWFGPIVNGATPELYPGRDGVRLDLHQEVRLAARLNTPDRWRSGQIQITNNTGRAQILAITLSSDAVQSRTGRN